MPETLPSLFLSHGSPALSLDPGETGVAWRRLAEALPRPQTVLAVSAHWMTEEPAVSAPDRNETIHDFYGFPQPLYRMSYTPPGAPALASRAVSLLAEAGIGCAVDRRRGLDHGAWVPLRLMYPAADIPTIQLAIQPDRDARWHHQLGAALAPLRSEGVLILASGGAVHNLRGLARQGGPVAPWAQAFDDWLAEALAEGRKDELLDWVERAPYALEAQPTPDHFLPLFVALGAAGPGARAERIHAGFTLGSLSMAGYRFAA